MTGPSYLEAGPAPPVKGKREAGNITTVCNEVQATEAIFRKLTLFHFLKKMSAADVHSILYRGEDPLKKKFVPKNEEKTFVTRHWPGKVRFARASSAR